MAQERFHALDATRAFALLLGIVLHATMSFFIFIPAQDSSQSVTLAVTFYVIHIFRMSLFFLIAGFFAHMLFHRRGARAFLKDRAKRILVPMAAGWVVLAPATIAIVIWGMSRTFDGVASESADAVPMPDGLPLTHLWFLYYLCIFYVLVLTVRAAFTALVDRNGAVRKRLDAIVRTGVSSYAAPIVLAAPLCAVLYLNDGWLLWFGLPTPDIGLAPKIPAMAGFGTAFGLGWLLHRQSELLDALRERWPVNLALALALTVVCLLMVGPTPDMSTPTAIGGPAWSRLVYAACYTASIWYWVFGLIGLAMRFCGKANPVMRYVADSSYWLYLAHMPIVFLLQVLVMDLPWHWTIKFPLIVATSLGVLLVSYHYFVRPTFIGGVLNGRRYPRRPDVSQASIKPLHCDSAGIAELRNVSKRYGTTVALDALTLAVRPGELLAVLGPNGAGKSTAIGLWLGLLEPDEGTALVMGASPTEVQSRLDVGVMMQDVNLASELRTRELIAQTASYYANPLSVDEVLALTGTAPLADKRYGRLSGGQKRQVQFATAVCGRPRLLFLDEPTVGLDVQAREAMWRTTRRLLDQGCSIVLTTHYLEEAEALADRVAVLANGKLVICGSVDEMRSIVTRKRITCACTVDIDEIRSWPGVVEAVRDERVHVTAFDAEAVVRRLLAADRNLSRLEVKQATLAEAFTELTREAA
jgi:ABC-type multidrug transport system ATPase subunit/fucose 4-O-acetylase-like acetyltransferase